MSNSTLRQLCPAFLMIMTSTGAITKPARLLHVMRVLDGNRGVSITLDHQQRTAVFVQVIDGAHFAIPMASFGGF